jgi:hypothetical protein
MRLKTVPLLLVYFLCTIYRMGTDCATHIKLIYMLLVKFSRPCLLWVPGNLWVLYEYALHLHSWSVPNDYDGQD